MKKVILFVILFIIPFCVLGEEISTKTYNEVLNKLNESYDKFIGACNPYERIAIIKYANGDLENLKNGFDTVISLVTSSGKKINNYCANYSEGLYDALKNVEDYVGKTELYSIILENEYIIKKNIFVNGYKILVEDELTIVDDCNLVSEQMISYVKKIIFYAQICSVSLAIIFCMVDLYKAFISKEVNGKEAFKKIKSRVIAMIVVLLIPIIVNIIIDLLNRYVNVDSLKCLES